MKLLAGLGLAVAGGLAFGGLVYVATPFLEELCGGRSWTFGGTPGGRFVGEYRGTRGSELTLRDDGTFSFVSRSEAPGTQGSFVEGRWRASGAVVLLEAGEEAVRSLDFVGPPAVLTSSGDKEQFERGRYFFFCEYGGPLGWEPY